MSDPPRFTTSRASDSKDGLWIMDSDFGWDAALHVTGDFGSFVEKLRFAQSICDVLNAHESQIPVCSSEGAWEDFGDDRYGHLG